jgi:prepilin-type N-terminal cleavage/methylation domain-containing protein
VKTIALPKRPGSAAFSLIEVMIALLILGVALAGLAQGITTAIRSSKDSELQTTAALLAAGQIELLRADGVIVDGVVEGHGDGGLSKYQWKQTVSPGSIPGLHEVVVEVRHSSETVRIFELRTLLFDPPGGSLTNRVDSGSSRKTDRKNPSRRTTR